jgi:hypothetical protein
MARRGSGIVELAGVGRAAGKAPAAKKRLRFGWIRHEREPSGTRGLSDPGKSFKARRSEKT